MRDTPPPTYYPDEIGEKCDAKEVSQSQLNYEIVNVDDNAHGTYTYTHICPSVPSAQVPNSSRGQSDESDRSSIVDSLAPGFLLSWRRSDDSTTAELTGTGRNCEIGDGDHQRRTRDGSPWRILLTSHTGRTSHLALQWHQYPV